MIRIDDDYSVRVDDACYTLVRTQITKKGKKSEKAVGYYNSLVGALERYWREKVREGLKNSSTSLSGAVACIREISTEVAKTITDSFESVSVTIREKE